MFGAVGHDNLTGLINAPKTSSSPAGWFSTHDGVHHVVYRSSNGHLRELWWQRQGGVGHGDLTTQANAVSAAGDPWPYYDPVRSINIDTHRVVYRAENGHLHELVWPTVAPVTGRDLTALSGAPPAADNVSGGYNPGDNSQHVIFRSGDGRLHELWHFLGETAVHHVDLIAAYAAPDPADRPVSYASTRTPNQHVKYRGTNGHIYELLW